MYALLAVGGAQELQEVSLKLVAVVLYEFFGVFANKQHLSDVRLRLGMHFKAILVTALLFADLDERRG